MQKDNYIVYYLTRNKYTGMITDFDFLNAFETLEQAKASLQYEADIALYEDEETATWLDEETLMLPDKGSSDNITTIHIDNSVSFHDREEPLIRYQKNNAPQKMEPLKDKMHRFSNQNHANLNTSKLSFNKYSPAQKDNDMKNHRLEL